MIFICIKDTRSKNIEATFERILKQLISVLVLNKLGHLLEEILEP